MGTQEPRALFVLSIGVLFVLAGDVGCGAVSDGDADAGADVPENTADRCSDGIDNDGDGNADCDDPDCGPFCSACTPTGSESANPACHCGEDNAD